MEYEKNILLSRLIAYVGAVIEEKDFDVIGALLIEYTIFVRY
jgi:hypothetical protein